METDNIAESQNAQSKQHKFKCKVREDQEVGRWKKEEHENFIKGRSHYIFGLAFQKLKITHELLFSVNAY